MSISRCRWRSGLGGNLGASDQNDIAVENELCDAEEAGHDLRIVVGARVPTGAGFLGSEQSTGLCSFHLQ